MNYIPLRYAIVNIVALLTLYVSPSSISCQGTVVATVAGIESAPHADVARSDGILIYSQLNGKCALVGNMVRQCVFVHKFDSFDHRMYVVKCDAELCDKGKAREIYINRYSIELVSFNCVGIGSCTAVFVAPTEHHWTLWGSGEDNEKLNLIQLTAMKPTTVIQLTERAKRDVHLGCLEVVQLENLHFYCIESNPYYVSHVIYNTEKRKVIAYNKKRIRGVVEPTLIDRVEGTSVIIKYGNKESTIHLD